MGIDTHPGMWLDDDMTTTTATPKIKFTRDGDAYKFACDRFTANIWKFESAYGDTQWGCDIDWQDGRTMTAEYSQFDYLENVRNWIGYLITEVAR